MTLNQEGGCHSERSEESVASIHPAYQFNMQLPCFLPGKPLDFGGFRIKYVSEILCGKKELN
jgi:hypothetical protein